MPLDAGNGPKAQRVRGMPKKRRVSRLKFKDERAILDLAAASKSLDEIAAALNRPPEAIINKAKTLGISFKSGVRKRRTVRRDV
jgi:hypothetical protein